MSLTPEEKRLYGFLFRQSDPTKAGVVTGENAVRLFEKSSLPPQALAEIWQIADADDHGFLTQQGFSVALRLVGKAQAGTRPTLDGAKTPGSMPRFEGVSVPSMEAAAQTASPPASTQPAQIPPVSTEGRARYTRLFENEGPVNGLLDGNKTREIFLKAKLHNETLGEIWNLVDVNKRGALDVGQFIIAMHLIQLVMGEQLKSLPPILPAGLLDSGARRASRTERLKQNAPSAIPIPATQFSGVQSPRHFSPQPSGAGPEWAISSQEKAHFDSLFNNTDTQGKGYMTGDDALVFFGSSKLPAEVLAHIWDLSDIRQRGQLTRDEFAVAMHLIRTKLGGKDLPETLPANLIPTSMRQEVAAQPPSANGPPQSSGPSSAAADLFGLQHSPSSAFSGPVSGNLPTLPGGTSVFNLPSATPPPPSRAQTMTFGEQTSQITQSPFETPLSQQNTGAGANDLLGDNDPEVNKRITSDTTELANFSNQIGSLTKRTQDLRSQKSNAQRDLSIVSDQKRDIQARLKQMRSMYDNEVQVVRKLEEQLQGSRLDTTQARQELSVLEGSLQALQSKSRDSSAALQKDQQENVTLKERMKAVNSETSLLKQTLEKVTKDARQQHGMVAISKKQVATAETEQQRLRDEITRTTATISPAVGSSSNARASPALSVTSQSTNPFHRLSPAPTQSAAPLDAPMALNAEQAFGRQSPFQRDPPQYESTFAPRPKAPSSPTESRGFSSMNDEGRSTATPISVHGESVSLANLPAGASLSRNASIGSSVQVNAPASARGDPGPSRADTPTEPGKDEEPLMKNEAEQPEAPDIADDITPLATPQEIGNNAPHTTVQHLEQVAERERDEHEHGARIATEITDPRTVQETLSSPPLEGDLRISPILASPPPIDAPMQSQTAVPAGLASPPYEKQDPTITNEQSNSIPGAFPQENEVVPAPPTATEAAASSKADFDAAFANLGMNRGDAKERVGFDDRNFDSEFPPIEEIRQEEDDSSENEGHMQESGFDDNFEAPAAPAARADVGPPTPAKDRPPFVYPEPAVQTQVQPPPQMASVAPPPIRAPTPPPDLPPDLPPKYPPGAASPPPQVSQPQPIAPAAQDDFDFGDLSEARDADKDEELTDQTFQSTASFDEFNPVFDTPTRMDDPSEFPIGYASNVAKAPQTPVADWDAIFAGFETPGVPASGEERSKRAVENGTGGGGTNESTRDDEPSVKELVGMGFTRPQAVTALEKNEYDLPKVDFCVEPC